MVYRMDFWAAVGKAVVFYRSFSGIYDSWKFDALSLRIYSKIL